VTRRAVTRFALALVALSRSSVGAGSSDGRDDAQKETSGFRALIAAKSDVNGSRWLAHCSTGRSIETKKTCRLLVRSGANVRPPTATVSRARDGVASTAGQR